MGIAICLLAHVLEEKFEIIVYSNYLDIMNRVVLQAIGHISGDR